MRVQWGQQSREEMGDFWLQVVTNTPAERQLLDQTFRAKWMAADAIGLEALIQRDPNRAALRDDIAVLYMELNRPAEAVPHFEAALALKPGSAPAHFNYGTALAAAGRLDDAVTQYQRALALRPNYAIAHNNLGTALLQLGRPAAGAGVVPRSRPRRSATGRSASECRAWSRARWEIFLRPSRGSAACWQLNPNWVTAISSLASLLAAAPDASIRRPEEAIRLADRAVVLTLRRDANTLDVLAVAHAAAGDFDRAVAIADEALALNPPAPSPR